MNDKWLDLLYYSPSSKAFYNKRSQAIRLFILKTTVTTYSLLKFSVLANFIGCKYVTDIPMLANKLSKVVHRFQQNTANCSSGLKKYCVRPCSAITGPIARSPCGPVFGHC